MNLLRNTIKIIKDWYIGGNFYLVTKNSKLEEIDRRSLGDQFVWGLSSGMRNFGLSHYHVPNAIEEHVPIYKITLQTLEKDTILENYYRIDDGKIFIEKNLPNDS